MIKKLLFKLLHAAGYYFRYASVLHHPSKKVMAPMQVLFFNEEERSFLEQSAASFNYSLTYSYDSERKLVKIASPLMRSDNPSEIA